MEIETTSLQYDDCISVSVVLYLSDFVHDCGADTERQPHRQEMMNSENHSFIHRIL